MDHPNPISKDLVRIVVVSPSDVQAERDMVSEVADRLNNGVLVPDLRVILEVDRWETESYPTFHLEGPQGHIDEILKIEDCDIVIGIFWARFGTTNADGRSNTEHELHNAQTAWEKHQRPHIMLYFSSRKMDPDVDTDQLKAVQQFKKNLPAQCFRWDYEGIEKFGPLLDDHLSKFLHEKYKPSTTTKLTEEPNFAYFKPPQFPSKIFRKLLLSLLRREIANHAVVAVEGLTAAMNRRSSGTPPSKTKRSTIF